MADALRDGLRARAGPEPALTAGPERWSWAELRRVVAAIEDAATRAGVGASVRVAVPMTNEAWSLAAAAAVLARGDCLVPLPGEAPAAAVSSMLDGVDLDAVVVSEPVRGRLQDALDDVGLSRAGVLVVEGAAGHVARRVVASAAPTERPLQLRTSGTTGEGKWIGLSDRQALAALVTIGARRAAGDRPPAPTLLAHPTSHIAALSHLLAGWSAGRHVIAMRRFEPDAWAWAVHEHAVRATFLVPAALRALLDARVDPTLVRSLVAITSGAAPCPAALADDVTRVYGVPVLTTYGATEFAGATAGWTRALHRRWWPEKAGAAGQALPGVELRVVGDDGAQLPQGHSGRLQVRSDQTSAPGRWVATQDVARLDADGFLWVEGRLDGVINRGGFTVRPERVEAALKRHPLVREAAVAPRPDERLGSVPVAVVEIVAGAPVPAEPDLLAHCRRHLLGYEVPVSVVTGPIPHTDMGKVDRARVARLGLPSQAPGA